MLDQLLPFVPDQYRPLALAIILALAALQVVVSQIIARLPASALTNPRWGWLVRAAHRFSHARLREEAGTVKLPGAGVRPPAEERALLVARLAEIDTSPAPVARDNPQRGRASAGALLTALLVSVLSAGLVVGGGCRPQPGPDGEVHTPSGVVATIDTIATILEVLLPVIRPLILREVPDGPAKPVVTYSLTAFEAAANAWMAGHTTWDARGADRCTAYALSGALVDATKSLSRDLARAGVGWGPDIEALLTSLGRLMDRYLGACSAVVDGGALTASGRVGSAVQMYLDDLRVEAQLRGRSLRPLPAVRR